MATSAPDVVLRRPRPSDRAAFLALRRRNRRHLAATAATPPDAPASRAAAFDFDALLRRARSRTTRLFFVCRVRDGAIIGQVAVMEIVRGALQSAYLGYWIDRAHEGRGLMRQAVVLALDEAFGRLGLHRVEANVQPSNRRSAELLRRLGFRREGVARDYLFVGGRWRDHVHWALLAEDWRRTRGAFHDRRSRRI